MKLSVIIPTCNRNEMLSRCLNCLAPEAQGISIGDYEVIVTDDSKSNEAIKLLFEKFSWVKWVEGPKRGPAANRNFGASCAKYDWLVFTDDDCLPSQNWLKSYQKAISSKQGLIFEGATTANRNKERFNEESPINLTGGNLWSCNFCINRNFFFEIGRFDEGFPFPAMEDCDLNVRIQKLEKVLFVPDALVIHPWRRMKAFNGYRKWILSHRYFLLKHSGNITMSFRIKRLKIFCSNLLSSTRELYKYSFKGAGFYFEKLWFDLRMIFISS